MTAGEDFGILQFIMKIGLFKGGGAVEVFSDAFEQLDRIYARYARQVGLSYTSLYVLHIISLSEACTQKSISAQSYLPKQTVNSIVMAFQKQGLVELAELPEDRRHKLIRLTEKGRAYAGQVIPQVDRAEEKSMAQFTPEERALLLNMLRRYLQAFSDELIK